ncbi:drug resistance transporter, EmrB/QacA subfamily [Beutenbergia cavernae DSM 12333]|uniref:Drug resistance transporter, EmrB/QacA subfamily n=1 Tax=Beutenbergia cavernae (strain ATCC BAA-8 / DSM 12333 / CCUG 43141 / JCM 11478 / NBRC 16432 / NCIMB 13614 / HKI 0122) TaxID=471853 RepID=C5C3L9_BEUC1|nr:DHA2 family efflux MFS transporter permease subunit [Beutenbergia cavernae]ACQ81928.1 drug resistance transporter, EmrB/QacA subfamily [Beutenbergia cavernae DSM 12333]
MSTTTTAPGSPAPGGAVDLHGRSPWSVIPPLALGFFMIMVDTTIVNIAVPTLTAELDADLVSIGWVNSAYLLSYAVLLLLAGRLGDRYGPKPVFVLGLVVFTAASAWCGLAGTVEMLIVARVVQGIGAALMTPQTMSMITRVFPPRGRGAAMGLWGAVAGVATITGPVLGGFLVETWGWEWIFFVNIPVGVIALVMAFTNLPRLATHKRSFDLLGVALSIIGLFAFVFGLQEGETYDWGRIGVVSVGPVDVPVTVVGLIVVGLLVLTGFVLWQHHLRDRALLPLSLFSHRNFSLANVGGMAVSFAMIGIFFPLTIYLQTILDLSPLHAALLNLPGSLVSGVVAPIAGRLSDRIPGKWVVAAGFAAIAGAVVWLWAIVSPDTSPLAFLAPMALFGVGTGAVFSPLANLATSGLDHRTAGAGAGAFNTTRQVGGVIGSAAIVAMLTARLSVTLPAAARDAAAGLPAELREPFVEGFSQAGGSFGGTMPALPPGIPDDVAQLLQDAATSAFHSGFATATGQTLLLAAGVLVVGMLAALAMDRGHHGGQP